MKIINKCCNDPFWVTCDDGNICINCGKTTDWAGPKPPERLC